MSALSHPQATFRDAMSRLGAAVSIITTDGPAGRYGVTVSSVCSVSDAPPTLLVCLNRSSRAGAIAKQNGTVCVNVLGAHHEALSRQFAGQSAADDDRFLDADGWMVGQSGLRLPDAIVAMDCRIADVHQVGSHDVLMCEVAAIHAGDLSGGLIYFNRRYHSLTAAA